tara:strand:- start:310 stop:612 length:303 start_codon:yes stop_codon:yes gene_type:complete
MIDLETAVNISLVGVDIEGSPTFFNPSKNRIGWSSWTWEQICEDPDVRDRALKFWDNVPVEEYVILLEDLVEEQRSRLHYRQCKLREFLHDWREEDDFNG